MSAVFLKILNLSYSASWLILAVIAVRLLLKKAPKWVPCLLWALVALRLIIPFSFESTLSLLPSGEVVPADIQVETMPHIESGIYVINSAVNPVMEDALAPAEANSVNPMQVIVAVLCIVWVAGILAMTVYAFISYVKIRRCVREAAPVDKGIMECDEVKSPFILGIIHPVIYVPSGMESSTLELVLAHEKAHICRKDYLWKPLGFALLSVYWFNPLSWVAYVLLCRDIESACDEKVIRDKSSDYMAAYSQALLDCSIQRRKIAACPVAFGETGVKLRIKNVLNYKKPAFWIIIVSLVACVVLAVCFLTNPKKTEGATGVLAAEDEAEFVPDENPVEEWNDDVVETEAETETETETHEFVWPTDNDLVTRGFSLDEENYHPEVDIAGGKGDVIYAATGGTITETGFDDKDGNYIIESADMMTITYCHLEEVNVNVNDSVSAGDVIGTMGSTGNSTGPHLAIRIMMGDEPCDFLELFDEYNSHNLPEGETDGSFYDYYTSDGSAYIRQDYRTGKSVIYDGDIEIPVDITMGSYGPRFEKFDADGDGTDEYLIAECEGTGTGMCQYGLCIVEYDGGNYKLTRYDSQYFADYLDENIGYSWDSARQEFNVFQITPAYVSAWFGIHVKPFEKHNELEKIVWSDIIDIVFEDGKVYLSAPTGYVYKYSPVPDYENAVRVTIEIFVQEDSSIILESCHDFKMDE